MDNDCCAPFSTELINFEDSGDSVADIDTPLWPLQFTSFFLFLLKTHNKFKEFDIQKSIQKQFLAKSIIDLLICLPQGQWIKEVITSQQTMRHGQVICLPVLPDTEYYWSAVEKLSIISQSHLYICYEYQQKVLWSFIADDNLFPNSFFFNYLDRS